MKIDGISSFIEAKKYSIFKEVRSEFNVFVELLSFITGWRRSHVRGSVNKLHIPSNFRSKSDVWFLSGGCADKKSLLT